MVANGILGIRSLKVAKWNRYILKSNFPHPNQTNPIFLGIIFKRITGNFIWYQSSFVFIFSCFEENSRKFFWVSVVQIFFDWIENFHGCQSKSGYTADRMAEGDPCVELKRSPLPISARSFPDQFLGFNTSPFAILYTNHLNHQSSNFLMQLVLPPFAL